MYDPKRIKIAMIEEGVDSPDDLAERAGKSVGTIRAALRGEDIRTSTLEAIAHALNRAEPDFFSPVATSKLVAAPADPAA